jgi:hypothetical protein
MPYAGPLLETPLQLSNLLNVGLKNRPNDLALTSLESVTLWRDLESTTGRLAANYLGLVFGNQKPALEV